MSKKSGRVVGSRYLSQSNSSTTCKKSEETHNQTALPRKQLSELNTNTQQSSNNQTATLYKSRTDGKYTGASSAQVQSQGRLSGSRNSGLNNMQVETERLAWAYLNQQTLLSLEDYRKEQDSALINLSGQVVMLHEQLYEKESVAQKQSHLEGDVDNLKSALSSILRINSSLNTRFLDLYDDYTAEIGARINQIELENAFVNSQGELENVLKEINDCLSSVSSNFENDMSLCKDHLEQIHEECMFLQPKFSENLKLLHQANQLKIKNMALLNTNASIR